MGKAIGIISIKGGVGKTTAISNLAASLANQFKKKVVVVDANFSAPNLAIHFGIINPNETIHSVISSKKNIKSAIKDTGHGFDMVPGQLNFRGKLEYLKLKNEIIKLKKDYDYVLIDSSPNLNKEMLATMVASDELFVVTTPDFPTLSCTMHAIKIAKERKTPISGLILNRVYNKNFELKIEDIEDAAECPVLAVIHHDVNVLEALSKTMPAHSLKQTQGTIEYNKLASVISNEEYKDPRFLNKMRNLFSKNLPKQEINRALFNQK